MTRPGKFRPLSRLFRWFGRDDGNATIEFVILFPVFITLMLSCFESALLMTRQVMLERALDMAVRGLRLGRWPNIEHDEFKQIVCDRAGIIPQCNEVLMVELRAIPKTTWDLPSPAATCVNRDEPIQPMTSFLQGPENELMLVRACVKADPFFPGTGLGLQLSQTDDGGYALISTSTFVNEPAAGS
ncbi:Flp pilus assembly protein TadG [Rhodovulum iodosum]|uniref:Flp pilus assembly protein TadG n=1 Tax=Rhodovulum iodosum TaxID=68291 RepID=A0ABV3XR49_9RHOB|nr:TadE/TadG family type IV pilus assembly protein [Rhodovulum robiginosum]RSK34770.1 pilus assembly protein [Rhodovulum robiginosum]